MIYFGYLSFSLIHLELKRPMRLYNENRTRFKTRIVKIYTHFQTKTAQTPYPMGRHTAIQLIYMQWSTPSPFTSMYAGTIKFIKTNQYTRLLSLSVSTCAVIGQFCGQYFTVWPAKLESFLPVCLVNLRDIINILLTPFSWSVLYTCQLSLTPRCEIFILRVPGFFMKT